MQPIPAAAKPVGTCFSCEAFCQSYWKQTMLSERATLPANKPKFYNISNIELPVYAAPKTYILGKYLD
ncbi:hypothetical protein D3C71_1956450 [compost metagenome]